MEKEDKTSMQGVFSIGEGENYNIVGSLSINESGEVYVDCIHGKDITRSSLDGMLNLIGKTSELGKVLLLDSFVISSNYKFSSELHKMKLLCNKLVCVDNTHIGFDIKTSKMTFEIEDLELWIAKPILTHQWEDNKNTYTYDLPEIETIDLGDGLSLTLSHSVSFQTGTFDERSEVRSRAFATFNSIEEKDIDFFIDKGVVLSNLVSFSLDSVCTIKNAYYGENENNKVIFQSSNRMEERKKINLINYIFTMRSVGERSTDIIKKWFYFSKKIRPTISLYNQLKSKAYRYSDGEFLALAQAAEALHARTCDKKPMLQKEYNSMVKDIIEKAGEEHEEFLRNKLSHGNELSFKKRLEMMLSVFWSDEEIEKNNSLLKAIVNTRNIFTHHPNRGDKMLITDFAYELEKYKRLLEKIIISNILYLISSEDKEFVTSIMNRINSFKFSGY